MKRNYLILFFLYCFLILIFTQWFFLPKNSQYSSILVRTNLLLALTSITIFFCYFENKNNLKKQTLRSIYLILLGFFIVHYQIYFDFEFGNFNLFGRNYIIEESLINEAILISLAGFISIMLGYINGIVFLNQSQKNNHILVSNKIPSITGFFSLLLFIGFLNTTDPVYFQGNYGTIERNYFSQQFEYFLILSIFSSFISSSYSLTINKEKLTFLQFLKKNNFINLITTCIYLLLVIASGDRGPFISITLLFIGSYLYSQNIKLKLFNTIIFVLIASFLISTLGVVREIKDQGFLDRIQLVKEETKKYESDYSVFKNTHELAISIRSWHTALRYIRDSDYKYGLIQLHQILNIIPGAGTIFKELTGLSSENIGSAQILTNYYTIHYAKHNGIGTTVIADIYLDFSIYGVIILLFFLGLFARKLDINSSSSDTISLFLWVCTLILLSRSIYIGRSNILIIFRDIFIVYIEIIFLNFLFKKRKNKFYKNTDKK